MRSLLIVVSLLILIQWASLSRAWAVGKKVAQSLMPFLELEIGARPVAVGGAFITVSGDPSSLFWNPAGLADVRGRDVFFSHTSWIADIGYNAAAVNLNLGDVGSFGLTALIMDYGAFYATTVDPNPANWRGYNDEGTFTVSEYEFGLGYARRLTDQFSVGGQVKYAYQQLGSSTVYSFPGTPFQTISKQPNRTTAIVYDLGTLYYFGFKSLRFAMTLTNFSNIQTPMTFKVGVGMNVVDLWAESDQDYSINVSVDALHPRDYSETMNLGVELSYLNVFFLRAGYKLNYDEQRWTLGTGVSPTIGTAHFSIDYSYRSFGIFNNVQSISVGITF